MAIGIRHRADPSLHTLRSICAERRRNAISTAPPYIKPAAIAEDSA